MTAVNEKVPLFAFVICANLVNGVLGFAGLGRLEQKANFGVEGSHFAFAFCGCTVEFRNLCKFETRI